ncbi:hypothetical protein LSH36_300g04094, partial [Paralvinella palmiformis]
LLSVYKPCYNLTSVCHKFYPNIFSSFQILVSEPKKLSQKLKVHFEDFWNISDTLAIILFVSGCVLRLIPSKSGYGKLQVED